jgi:hypothetical protein
MFICALCTLRTQTSRSKCNSISVALRAVEYDGVTGKIRLNSIGDRFAEFEALNVLNEKVTPVGVWTEQTEQWSFFGDIST